MCHFTNYVLSSEMVLIIYFSQIICHESVSYILIGIITALIIIRDQETSYFFPSTYTFLTKRIFQY